MPSQRKRIGFLPRLEVQNIIDKICKHNKLSQSKVTGILVEEALISRGVLNSTIDTISFDYDGNNSRVLINNSSFNSDSNEKIENKNLEEAYIKNEVQMINDYLEFKLFKKLINKNRKKFES